MACLCLLNGLVFFTGLFVLITKILLPLVRHFRGEKPVELQEKSWQKDVVYLYQMKGSSTVSSVSPFCVKVEAYLRLHDIKFERRNTTTVKGRNGKIPFIELNGEQIPDSQLIIRRLAEKFNIKDYSNGEEAAFGHSVDRLVDGHTMWLLYFYKSKDLSSVLGLMLTSLPDILVSLLVPIASPLLGCFIRGKVHSTLGKFTEAEYFEMLKNDLRHVQTILGSKDFLFGADPTPADCTLFGHLSTSYFLFPSSSFVPSQLIDSAEFAPLKKWIDRFRDRAFGSNFHE